ncbi:carbon storage regulator, CsrA [Caloramator fervidus]|uniref:Translational regulator CsrA n=1 Tax=Caloramator fervidus TaxID=29344 RepID=A0A1H5WJY9_9CLOT|nr:carbon storage regulator CsrA [Caloramator fervidus]SEF99784.1 carbon storage regulator, CsrA [Caloramator fervidus]
MLVLTRKQGESILIGEGIEIKIIEVSKNEVKIGIQAPRDVKIVRKELISEIKNENLESLRGIERLLKRG